MVVYFEHGFKSIHEMPPILRDRQIQLYMLKCNRNKGKFSSDCNRMINQSQLSETTT